MSKLEFDSKWPQDKTVMGQVGGVATDSSGNVYVFHRGNRTWNAWSFDNDNNFQKKNEPIVEDVVFIYSREGKLVKKFGAGKYFMPHGIEVDRKGNIC